MPFGLSTLREMLLSSVATIPLPVSLRAVFVCWKDRKLKQYRFKWWSVFVVFFNLALPSCRSLCSDSDSTLYFPFKQQIFSLVVFASIVNEGYVNMGSERLHCIFNKNTDACNYGVFVGLVGLLACSFFFLLDYKFSSISSVKDRKKAVMLEIGFSGEDADMWWEVLFADTSKQGRHRAFLAGCPGVSELWQQQEVICF